MLQKNDLIPLTIHDITNEGSGVGRYDGMAVFVPGAAVGDVLTVRVVKVLKKYAYGIIHQIEQPASCRIEDDCPVSRQCGGCCLRHMDYEEEKRIKEGWVTEHFRRIGGIDVQPLPIEGSPAQTGYRNKAQYPVRLGDDGRVKIGFFAARSHRIVENLHCALQPDFFGDILTLVKDFLEEYKTPIYNEESHTGLVRHIFLRWGEKTGEVMVCLVIKGKSLPHQDVLVARLIEAFPSIASVQLNHNTAKTNVILGQNCTVLYGKPTISDVLCGVQVELSPLSFYQVNRSGAEKLYSIGADFAELCGDELLLDLYCGAGTIGLSMANRVKEVIGVEIVAPAVENAIENAKRNNIKNARFFCDDAAGAARRLAAEGLRPDVIVLDPPRKGCEASLFDTIAEMAPKKVVMISCNSATAARDAAILCQKGYRVDRLQAVDMFPRTYHVECVVRFTRCEGVGSDKLDAFCENARLLKDSFGITPLLYGSLGLQTLTGEDLKADDIDILIPQTFLGEGWNGFRSLLEQKGYTLIDEAEHTFEKNGIHFSYAMLEELERFAGIPVQEIAITRRGDTAFLLLNLPQYLKVYTASAQDGYRVNVRGKKDGEKIDFIKERLGK